MMDSSLQKTNYRMRACSVVSNSLRFHGLCSPPGSSVHGILQARILEWVTISSSRGSFQPRDQTRVSYISCTGRQNSLPLSQLRAQITGCILFHSCERLLGDTAHQIKENKNRSKYVTQVKQRSIACYYCHSLRKKKKANIFKINYPLLSSKQHFE